MSRIKDKEMQLDIYTKINTQKVKVYDASIEVFNLIVNNEELSLGRFFQEPLLLSENSKYLAVVERKFVTGQVLALTRIVIFDFNNKKQWCTAWDRWVGYSYEELKEKSDKGIADKIFNFIFRYEGVFRYQVKRQGHITPPKSELVLLPTDDLNSVSFNQSPRLNLESEVEERKISFNSNELIYYEKSLETKLLWSSVDRIIFFKEYSEFLEATGLKFMGSTTLQIAVPSKNFTNLLDFLSQSYLVPKEKFYELINCDKAQELTLWAKNNKTKIQLSDREEPYFEFEEFKEGIKLQNKELLKWTDLTLHKIRSNPKFVPAKLHEADGFRLQESVVFGPFLLSDLFIYRSSFKGEEWIADYIRFDFDQLPVSFNSEKLIALLKPLVRDESSWFKSDPFDCMIFNSFATLSLCNQRAFWEGSISPSFDLYWQKMREIHPKTCKINISEKKQFNCSTTSVQSATFNNKTKLQQIPTPKIISQDPLTFWRDNQNDHQGVSSYNTCFYWRPDELKNIRFDQKSYPGERGMDDYVVDFVTIIMNDDSELYFEFSDLKKFHADSVLNFLKGRN